jgi:hypothetical protein
MGHHGQDGHGELPPELREALDQEKIAFRDIVPDRLRELQRKIEGEHPEGVLNPEDQGALMVAFGVEQGKVILAFPKPIDWVALGPDQAREAAETLLERAKDCDGIEAHVRRVTSE